MSLTGKGIYFRDGNNLKIPRNPQIEERENLMIKRKKKIAKNSATRTSG
jgi:hypothetical protein